MKNCLAEPDDIRPKLAAVFAQLPHVNGRRSDPVAQPFGRTASGIGKLAVHMDHLARPCPFMQVVDVLRDDNHIIFALELGNRLI